MPGWSVHGHSGADRLHSLQERQLLTVTRPAIVLTMRSRLVCEQNRPHTMRRVSCWQLFRQKRQLRRDRVHFLVLFHVCFVLSVVCSLPGYFSAQGATQCLQCAAGSFAAAS